MQVLSDRHEDVRYIVDGAMPRLSLAAPQSFVAHSPNYSRYKEYMKQNAAAAAPLYMPFWDEEELNIVRQRMHPAISEWQVRLFRILSPLRCPSCRSSRELQLLLGCASVIAYQHVIVVSVSADAAADCTKGSSPQICAGKGALARIGPVDEGSFD